MDDIARASAGERAALFQRSAARSPVHDPLLIEKDFWVCWVLHRLGKLNGAPRMLFKGGTSLSKGFGLIHRFSEDVDLSIARQDLGIAPDQDPLATRTRSAHQRAVRLVRRRLESYVRHDLVRAIEKDFAGVLREDVRVDVSVQGAESVVLFHYPAARGRSGEALPGQIAESVRLEFGARSDPAGARQVRVRPYAADAFPDAFREPECRWPAQAPERTLIEKALLLHASVSRGRLLPQASRHAYDLVQLARAGVLESVTRSLFETVTHQVFVFGDDRRIRGLACDELLMCPQGELSLQLSNDYRQLHALLFHEPEPPTSDELLHGLVQVQLALWSL